MSLASKNPFDLLGGDDDGEGSAPAVVQPTKPSPPTQSAPKSSNTPRRGANEVAFRDRNAGSANNREKPTNDNGGRGPPRGGAGARVRGGRGATHPRNKDDRHSKHAPSGGSEKQAAQSWGVTEGEAELKDEEAGEKMAEKEKAEEAIAAPADGKELDAPPAETEEDKEEKQVSYAQYLQEQAEKKAALEGEMNIRKANEGSNLDKKWANAKPLEKTGDEAYFEGTSGKAKRERERKTKQVVELDHRHVEPERGGGAGGGRGRGGGFRGGRGGERGRGAGGRGGGFNRGDNGDRGGFRRGRGGDRGGDRSDSYRERSNYHSKEQSNAAINTDDQSAFPSLGS